MCPHAKFHITHACELDKFWPKQIAPILENFWWRQQNIGVSKKMLFEK